MWCTLYWRFLTSSNNLLCAFRKGSLCSGSLSNVFRIKKKPKIILALYLNKSCKSSMAPLGEVSLAQQPSPASTGWGRLALHHRQGRLVCRQDACQRWACIGAFLRSTTCSSHNSAVVTAKGTVWSCARCQFISRQPQADTMNCTYPLPIDPNQKDDLADHTLPHPKAVKPVLYDFFSEKITRPFYR